LATTDFDRIAKQARDRVLAEMIEQLGRLHWDHATLAGHRRSALAATLAFAVERSPWHAERLARVDLGAVAPDDLTSLPIMTKRDLMANWDRAVTDRRLKLEQARDHLASVDADGPSFLLDEYLVFATGGSTGEPGVFPWSLDEFARWVASSVRLGADLGDPPPERMTFLGARSPRHPSAMPPLLLYGVETGRRHTVPIDQPLGDVVSALNAADPDSMWVVSSVLPALVAAKASGTLSIAPDRIAVGGDWVDPAALDAAATTFGVRPTVTYPTTDLGHVAAETPGEGSMTMNDDLLIVETVDADEQPVPPGDLSHHVLVTSLHHRTIPMIRYRLDDRIRIDPTQGRYAAYGRIAEIDGRADDLFHYPDAIVHPHVFRSVLCAHASIADHQVRQTDCGAHVSVIAEGALDIDRLRADLRVALGRAGLSDPDVTIEPVDMLPRSAVGKRLHFIAR
jgi:phenylacetate-coenzyme A ligase PaaK-like adenylate-forming protein